MNQQDKKDYVQTPVSLIKYQAPIHISNLKAYQDTKNQNKNIQLNPTIQDILTIIIPPREVYSKSGELYIQNVNNQKLKREDVENLKQKLQQLIVFQKAKKQGICFIRQKIFSEAFDQIIRQVIIDCPQRGIMLMRLRDQRKMTLSVYQTLYKESLSFSRIKISQNQSSLIQLQKQFEQIKNKHQDLIKKKSYLQSKKLSLQLKQKQFKTILKDKKKHQTESLQFQQSQLSKFLQKMRMIQKQKNVLLKTEHQPQENEQILVSQI